MINQSGEPDVQQHGRINRTLAQQRNTKATDAQTPSHSPHRSQQEGLRYMRLKRRPPPV